MRKNNTIQYLINAATFIALEVAALTILCNNSPIQDTWFGSLGQSFRSAVWGWTDSIGDYFSLDETNDSLAIANARLMEKVAKLETLIQDEEKTNDAFLNNIKGDFSYIPAQITKMSNSTQHNYILLNKGAEDGITKGSGIITEKGVIGIIDAVSDDISYGRSFQNYNMSISTRLGRSGPTGSMGWDGTSSDKAILLEIPHHIEVIPGDTVYTSGYSSIFPADLPLGTTVSSKVTNGASHEITVQLFQEFNNLRYVVVVKNNNLEEINSLEVGR